MVIYQALFEEQHVDFSKQKLLIPRFCDLNSIRNFKEIYSENTLKGRIMLAVLV